ncbi:DUF885 domain-containing protein [Alteromonas sp. a30]|uniref:DUF885 domain-containing protein n=1 Tax=Alteromonas sp. a30 TaxID=2730917 RepID=UPI0022830812|nr:DUF885 family protein [Alteromonas sp. a30]MCY7293823.1 DUF885 domain-containing protein [Alteromonas sp. a30]
MKKLLLAIAVSAALTACSNPSAPTSESSQLASEQLSASDVLTQKVDQHTLTFLKQQPALATMLAIDTETAGGEYNHAFPGYSQNGMNKTQTAMKIASMEVAAVDTSTLNSKEKAHQQIVSNIFEYYAGSSTFKGGYIDTWAGHLPYIINQISGPLIDIPKLMQVQQSVTSKEEIHAYLTRLKTMNVFVSQVVDKYREDMKNGVVLPKKLHPKTLAFFNNFLSAKPAEHELVRTFAEKLNNITSLSDEQKQDYIQRAARHVEKVVYPAYQNAKLAVEASEKIAKNSDGIWSQPGGSEFYQHSIHFLGDSNYSPEKIHNIGLAEVERISKAMDEILKANGLYDGTVAARMIEIAKMPEQLYADTDEGRKALLNSLNDKIKTILTKAPEFYGTVPTQDVEVRRIPAVSEAGEAGGFYTPPSLDGKRPGIYWINLRDMAAVPKFGLDTLTYHEAVPGHHFQIALNMAQQDIGLMRQNAPYNAYVEGWALYSEYFASEMMKMYEGNPFGDLGRLQAELYRAVRLVVDTGLHFKKWTREQAIDYFHTTTGTSLSDVVPEVERYMAWPGQALGYKLGMLKFVELQQKAIQELGEHLDYRQFHDLILLQGARPMAMVEKDVNAWIAAEKAKI